MNPSPELDIDRGFALMMQIATFALVALMLWVYLPLGVKEAIRRAIVAQLWAYQLGRYRPPRRARATDPYAPPAGRKPIPVPSGFLGLIDPAEGA